MLMAAGLGLGGCVAQQSHDQLMDANRSLTDRNQELVKSNQELQNENALLQKQRTANEQALSELTRQNAAFKEKLAAAGMSLSDLEKRMSGIAMGALDPETDRALATLAEQYPDLVKYDSARGMLRFASDLTFTSGSDSVQESAKQSLSALAKILGSGAAAQYEVMIMGHTDAQRISAGTAQRHPTNMHLSAHRAIAVRSVLATMGVPADKMFVAGWGEFRPIVPNSGKGDTPANRRVEIYLTRSTNSMSNEETTPAPAPAPPKVSKKSSKSNEAPPSRQPDLTK